MDDNLESLDNTTLRQKCMQYGLPNVPVTDSSRKVLIKRLRVSMGGGGKATKPREATPKKPLALNTTVSEKVTPRKTQVRRTIAAEPPLPKPHIEKTIYIPTKPIVEQNQNVLLFSNFSTQQEEVRPLQRASSLTPSEKLAKSGVVTTSYSQETAVLEDDYEDDYEDEPYFSQSPTERNATRPLPTYQIGHGLAHPIGGFFKNTESQSYISQPTVERNFTRPSPTTTVPSYGATSGQTYLPPERTYNRNTLSTLSQPKIDINKPTLTRRYTEYTSVNDNDDEEDEVDEVQTPYLSSFARALDRLKSGDITKLTPLASVRKQTSLFGQRQTYGYNKSLAAGDDSVTGALRQFVIALEHKYQLKRAFALFLVFVLAVFIYVFFIM